MQNLFLAAGMLLNKGSSKMTNGELIQLLEEFPPELPVFFSPDDAGRVAVTPRDAVMNLVDPIQGDVIEDDNPSAMIDRFIDSVVIYPRPVRM